MARQLTFEIVAQTYEAEAKLRYLENEIAELNKQLKLGTLTWEQYEKELKSASASAADAKQNLDDVKKGTQEQTKSVSLLQSAIMRYAGPAGIAYAIKQSVAWADQIDDLSAKSGIGVVQLQKLSVVAGRSGVSIEQVSNASAKLLRELGDPNSGGLNDALSRMGINVEKFRKLDPGAAFEELARAVARLNGPQEQLNALTQIFGERMARTLRPALLEVAKGLEGIAAAVGYARDALPQLNLGNELRVMLAKSPYDGRNIEQALMVGNQDDGPVFGQRFNTPERDACPQDEQALDDQKIQYVD